MESVDLLHDPAFILFEWFLLGGMGILFTGMVGLFMDARAGRRELHLKVEGKIDGLRGEFKSDITAVKEGMDKHSEECRQNREADKKDREADQRWMGGVNQVLKFLSKDKFDLDEDHS